MHPSPHALILIASTPPAKSPSERHPHPHRCPRHSSPLTENPGARHHHLHWSPGRPRPTCTDPQLVLWGRTQGSGFSLPRAGPALLVDEGAASSVPWAPRGQPPSRGLPRDPAGGSLQLLPLRGGGVLGQLALSLEPGAPAPPGQRFLPRAAMASHRQLWLVPGDGRAGGRDGAKAWPA